MAIDEALFDVVIVGGAAVGLSCALALRTSGLRVALCDRMPLAINATSDAWDVRVYAISPGSALFLHSIGIWQRLAEERMQSIEGMRVLGDGAHSEINFSAYDLGERALAWIVENRSLQNALVQATQCAAASGDWLDVLAPAELQSLAVEPGQVSLKLTDGRVVRTRLVVGADGVQSWTRQAAGIGGEPRAYGQSAAVANFSVEVAHQGRAWQWFLGDEGVLAWLPLPGERVSIVWSLQEDKAAQLLQLSRDQLAEAVAAAGNAALGRMECITAPASFPLQFLRLATPIAPRVTLVGDAAHCVHPLAGQGLNLGLADAQALAGVLSSRGPVSDCGTDVLLRRFVRARAEAVLAMQVVTDGLARLFRARDPLSTFARNRGLTAVDRLSGIKHLLAQPALR